MTTKWRVSMATFEYANLKYRSWWAGRILSFLLASGFLDFKCERNRCDHATWPLKFQQHTELLQEHKITPLCSLPGLLSHIWCQAKSKPRLGTVEHLILLWPGETPLTFQVKQVQNLSQVMPFAVKTLCHFFIGYNYAQDNRVGTVMWSNKGSANCSLLCTAEAFTN